MNGTTYLGSLLAQAGALFGTHVLILFTNFSGPPAFTQCSVTTISLNHQQTNNTANQYQSAILSSSCKTSLYYHAIYFPKVSLRSHKVLVFCSSENFTRHLFFSSSAIHEKIVNWLKRKYSNSLLRFEWKNV